MTATIKNPATIRLLAPSNFVIPWDPWHGLTLADVVGADPDAAFALLALSRKEPCPPLLARAVAVVAQIRRLQLSGRLPRRRPRGHARSGGRRRFVSVQI